MSTPARAVVELKRLHRAVVGLVACLDRRAGWYRGTVRRGFWVVVMLALVTCARRPAPAPASTDVAEPAPAPRDSEALVVADFEAPAVSAQSLAAWARHAETVCARLAPKPPPPDDCAPSGHATPCRARDFEAELAACDGSWACLQVARAADECKRCGVELSDGDVNERIADVAGDCEGLLRFVDTPKPHWLMDLDSAAHTPAAIECLARSRHPRARFLLAKWQSDPTAKEILLKDPEATRAWIRHEFSRARAGETVVFDAWTLWAGFDLLGVEAEPLAADVRRLAAHPFVGRWDRRDFVHDAIRRLGALKDTGSIELLRRTLADHRDWMSQAEAARALAELGPLAAEATPALQEAATRHWSEDVRALAAWAAARTQGEGKETPPTHSEIEWRADDRCPVVLVSVHGDGLGTGGWEREPWPWAVQSDGSTARLPDRERAAPVVPKGFPRVDLSRRFAHIEGHGVALHERPSAILPVRRGWVVGTNFGEFGGSLWSVEHTGRVRHLVRANVHEIVELGGERYAVTGLGHMGSEGALIRILDTPRGVQVEHALELPEAPGPFWVRDDELYLGTWRGVFIIDADMHVRRAPCVADRPIRGELSGAQVDAVVSRQRAIVDRCIEALPSATLPCGEASPPEVGLWLRVDERGAVTDVEPMREDWLVQFPAIEACLVERAKTWRFPAPKGGRAMFGYTFARER